MKRTSKTRIRLQRHPELVAEADDLEGQLLWSGKGPQRRHDALAELLEGEVRGIDGRLGRVTDIRQHEPLADDGGLHPVVLGIERMPVAGLRVAPHEGLVAGFEEDDLGLDATSVERPHGGSKGQRRVALADVEHDGNAVVALRVAGHELGEVTHERARDVIDDGVAEVLEDLARGGLPGAREAGDDDDVLVPGGAAGKEPA